MTVEPSTTLLDMLRDELAVAGTKKGCDAANAEHDSDALPAL
jgi:aerobic-type carbon monoxide dehydrogenase small subunit (CoxS/CutS family)